MDFQDIFEEIWENASMVFKMCMVAIIGALIINYVSLNIAVDKTIKKAEQQGYISNSDLNYYINKLNLKTELLEIERCEPSFGTHVNKLGDPLILKISNGYTITIFNQKIPLKYNVKGIGVNKGYYGDGY